VFSYTTPSTSGIVEGTNLYFTDARARASISVTGAGSYNSTTGVINIVGGVTSFNTRTGAITLSSADVTGALGFTPYNSTNPNGYITGITSSNVTTALGFTPYNATNPSGYISGITSGMVTTALGYTPYNSSNPSGYITSSALSGYLTSASAASTYLPLAGGTITGSIIAANNNVGGVFGNLEIGYGGRYNTLQTKTNADTLWLQYGHSGPIGIGYGGGDTTFYGKALFQGAVNSRPQAPNGILGLDTGDGNFDIWGISRDYYPSNATAANAWGIRWDGDGNQIRFIGGGNVRVSFDLDDGTTQINGNTVLHAGNYNSYAPTLTGTGASGTWGINVTGYSKWIDRVPNYQWLNATLPTGYNSGVETSFVSAAEGWPNYGVVLSVMGRVPADPGGNFQLYMGHGASYGGLGLRVRSINQTNNAWTSWKILLDETNYSSYALPLTGGTLSGDLRLTAIRDTSGVWILGKSGSEVSLGSAGAVNEIRFNSSSAAAFEYRGSAILHAGNYSSYAVPLSGGTMSGRLTISPGWTTSGRNYSNEWIELGNYSGLYSPLNGAHFYPNNGSYGGWRSAGSRNGWGGIEFDGSNGNVTLMISGDSNTTGFHNNNSGWQVRWAGGELFVYKNSYGGGTAATVLDSSNYSSYALPISGGVLSGAIRAPQITAGGSTNTDANLGVQGSSHFTGTIYYGGTVGNVNSWSSISTSSSGTHTFSGSRFVFDRYGYGSQALITLENGAITLSQPTIITGLITSSISNGTVLNMAGQTDSFGYNGTAGQGTYIKGTGATYIYGGGKFFDGATVQTLLHAGNFSSYALPLSGGTLSGALSATSGLRSYYSDHIPGNGYGIRFWESNAYKISMGEGSLYQYGTVTDYSIKMQMDNGSPGRGFTWGRESFAPVAALNGTTGSFQTVGAVKSGNNMSRPNASWGSTGATGMVIFKLPGSSGNYGMVHMVFDIYEYNSNSVSTVIVGGHNWASSWYNTGANVIGQLGKQVRLGYKDGQYCVVFGDASSYWEYGTIVFRKIHNGDFYNNIMDLGAAVSVEFTATESFSNIGGDLRALRTPASFNAGGAITQAGNQVLHAGNYTSYTDGRWGGFTVNQFNDRNIRYYGNSSADLGFAGLNSSGAFRWQLYGEGSNYGFLNGVWGGWDLRKTNGGALHINENVALHAANFSSYALPIGGGTVGDLRTNFVSGAGGHSFGANHYSMGKDIANGSWSHPHYSDLIIGYHTGIRLGGAYSGIRFYNNSPTTDANNDGNGDSGEALLMTVGGYVGNAGQDVNVNNTIYAASYRGNANVGGTGQATHHPAGIYSQGTNWLYGTIYTNGNGIEASGATCTLTATRANRANGNFYIDDNYGCGIVGAYASTRYQGVFFMGDSYKMSADGTSLANMYGIGWSHPNAGGAAGNLTDHGMLIINNGGFRCAISNSIVASGNITAYSDERLKTNWRDMPEDYVTRLAQVKVGIYDRIDEKEMSQVGVSAQSFQKLLPEAILTAKDEMQTLSVSYGNAALASSVELAKEVVDLKTRVAQLEALIEKLIKE
jgi:hypothetical protein